MLAVSRHEAGVSMRNLAACAIFLLSFLPSRVLAQPGTFSGEVRGRVVDPSKAAIPQTPVAITNRDTGLKIFVKTDDIGEYRFMLLQSGTYEVRVEAAGFAPYIKSPVQVTVGQIVIVDFQLDVNRADPVFVDVTD